MLLILSKMIYHGCFKFEYKKLYSKYQYNITTVNVSKLLINFAPLCPAPTAWLPSS